MTPDEQSLADNKMRAEIAGLIAETARIQRDMKYRFWVLAAAYVGGLAALFKIFG